MPKLLLINPVGRRSGYMLSKVSRFQPLGLGYVAALTPSHWDIEIIDENITEFTYQKADLVGITAFTSSINRAYEIARQYRQDNTKVVIGGIHASMTPEEVERYADAVVVGEVETIWRSLVDDFEKDQLKPMYVGDYTDLSQTSIYPRRDLFHPDYLWQSIQTSRGCPFNCNFCSVSNYLGTAYRQRSAEDVLDELSEISHPYIFFVDDNLVGYTENSRSRAKEIFRGMISRKLNKKWWMQTSINAAEDDELLRLAAQSGCMYVFIGFETINTESLHAMQKGVNLNKGVSNYKEATQKFHRHGIGVMGAFVIGNENESPAYYKRLAKFVLHSGIDSVQVSILTPLPGTKLMEDVAAEGNLKYDSFPQDWDRYRFSHLVHQPSTLKESDVYIGNNLIKKTIYAPPQFFYRMLRSALWLKKPEILYFTWKLNKALKKSWLGSHYYQKYPKSF